MSESEAAGGPEAITELECHAAHRDGHVSAAWLVTDPQVLAVVTAGKDGVLARKQIRPAADPKTTRMTKGDVGINVLELNADSTMAVIGVNSATGSGCDVKLVNLTGDFVNPDESKKITRFSQAVHCCCWSRDGKGLLIGSDDGLIKICTVPKGSHSSKVAIQIRTSTSDTAKCAASPASLRGVALDPEFKYAAAVSAAGEVWVWELTGGDKPSAKEEMKKKIAPEVDHQLEPAIRQGLAWHPDGTLLAVAGRENDVVLLERFNWHPSAYLTGGHTGPVRAIAFSPNGLYAATAGEDCRVVVWLVESRMQVAVRQLPAPASSLSWHKSANLLLCGTTAGSYAVWPKTVPTDQDANLPSPYKSIDEVERDADVAAAAAAAAAADADADGLEDEDEDGGAVVKRRGLKKTAAAADDSAAAPRDEFDAMFDQLEEVMQEADAEAGFRATTAPLNPTIRGLYPGSTLAYAAPEPKQPQAPIQPGSTPEGGENGEVAARFLAYNKLGWVVSKAGDGQNYIEVSFRDSSKARLQPKLVDLYGFTAASLGPTGVAYISPAAGEDRPSMLMFRPFESWSGEREWTVALPAGEDAVLVAAGSSGVAIATNTQKLRLYSCAGRQLAILSLQGPPVALVAAGASAAGAAGAACEHHLAVVWARGPPEPLYHTQRLDYMVLDVSSSSQVARGEVVLSAGASLTWLAFSQEGLLAAMDSAGTLRMRTPDWGGSWVPVLDAASAKSSAGSDSLWPVFLDAKHLTAVVTSKKAPHPQVLPHPINTQVPLALPGAPAEAASTLEDQLLLQGLLTAHVSALATSAGAADAEGVSAELESSKVSADRLAIKAFRDYVAGDKQGRALELLDSMNLMQSLEGALKLSQHYKRHQLAERVQQAIEQRLEWEEQQAAAAAAAAQQATYLHEADLGWAAAATGGDENDMQVQQDQASQFHAGNSSGYKPADARSDPQGAARGKVPAMFGAAAAVGGSGAGSGGFAGVKRKPSVAIAAGGKAGAGSNPFARKKAK